MDNVHIDEGIRGVSIICGYKNFGLIGALVVNQLIESMPFEEVGSCSIKEIPPLIAIREKKIFKPVSVLYNKEHNLLVIFILAPARNMEWRLADIVEEIYHKTEAKEIIIPDGLISDSDEKVFYISHPPDASLDAWGKELDNTVITGITSAMLLKQHLRMKCLFGNSGPSIEAQALAAKGLPSNQAAISLIKVINAYLGLKIRTTELEKMGEDMESQMESYINKVEDMRDQVAGEGTYIG